MIHHNRRWVVTPAESSEDLAGKLTEQTWTCHTGFVLGGYVWLNDATCPHGAQEYAVVKLNRPNGKPLQLGSITLSWYNYDEILWHVRRTLRGDDDNDLAFEVSPTLDTPDEHGRCGHCP